jgi:hypothetical protein
VCRAEAIRVRDAKHEFDGDGAVEVRQASRSGGIVSLEKQYVWALHLPSDKAAKVKCGCFFNSKWG